MNRLAVKQESPVAMLEELLVVVVYSYRRWTAERPLSLAPGQGASTCKQSAVLASSAERKLDRPVSALLWSITLHGSGLPSEPPYTDDQDRDTCQT